MEFAYKLWKPLLTKRHVDAAKLGKSEARKVTIAGSALKEGFVDKNNLIRVQFNQPKEISLGPTTFIFDGPSKAEVDFRYDEGQLNRFLYISYQVSEAGTYRLYVNQSNYPIKGSPFIIEVRSSEDEKNALKIQTQGLKDLAKLIEGEKVLFKLSTKYAVEGVVRVMIESPQKRPRTPLSLTRCGKYIYKISFTPKYPGYYFIHVTFNGFHIPGSPLRAECPLTRSNIPDNVPELPKDNGTGRKPFAEI